MFDKFLTQLPQFLTLETGWYLVRAMGVTLWMTAAGCGIGFVLALAVAFTRTTTGMPLLPLRAALVFYVEFFRRVPFLVLLFLVLFVAKGFGFDISLLTVGIVTIVIIATAYISEIIRAGLDSVHQAQWEAASAMNFSRLATLRYVILPQAWKVILPAAFVYFVSFIKDTAVASQIGVIELTHVGKYFSDHGYSAILAFGSILAAYFVLSYPLMRFGWWLEGRLKRRPLGDRPLAGPAPFLRGA